MKFASFLSLQELESSIIDGGTKKNSFNRSSLFCTRYTLYSMELKKGPFGTPKSRLPMFRNFQNNYIIVKS